jgi:glycosyltransferase involved in cell wall biosynthesis
MSSETPSVAILMCTYNGAKHLPEQLASFAAQTYQRWSLWVNDDGSTDDTRTIIAGFAGNHPNHTVSLADGPKRGHASNFLQLTARAGDAQYYAYSDQDDIWEPDHLARGIDWLKSNVPEYMPGIYGSRTLYVTDENLPIGCSKEFKKPPCFANALMQSIMGANTMILNRAARDLIAAYADKVTIVGHDWWAYMLITGCGGIVHYDSVPNLRYRQHGNNVLGQNTSLRAKLARAGGLFSGRFKEWNETNLVALAEIQDRLTKENRILLHDYMAARQKPLPARLVGLWRSGIHRQTLLGNLGLVVAAMTGKI